MSDAKSLKSGSYTSKKPTSTEILLDTSMNIPNVMDGISENKVSFNIIPSNDIGSSSKVSVRKQSTTYDKEDSKVSSDSFAREIVAGAGETFAVAITADPTYKHGEGANNKTDMNLIFGLERTLYAAINLDIILVFFGIGLLMVPHQMKIKTVDGIWLSDENGNKLWTPENKLPERLGQVFVVLGLVHMVLAILLHFYRVYKVIHSQSLYYYESQLFTGSLVLALVVCICFEFYYGLEYPYMKRAVPVDVDIENSVVDDPRFFPLNM